MEIHIATNKHKRKKICCDCQPQWGSPLRPTNRKDKINFVVVAAMEIFIASDKDKTAKEKKMFVGCCWQWGSPLPTTNRKEKYILCLSVDNGDPHCRRQQTQRKKKYMVLLVVVGNGDPHCRQQTEKKN